MTPPIPFTKMHGLGNDYVFVHQNDVAHCTLSDLAVAMSDRHRGIGSDGLIVLSDPDDPAQADLRMRIFNADGSEAEMCGNGIRCVAKLAYETNRVAKLQMTVQSAVGLHAVHLELDADGLVEQVAINMGCAEHDLNRLPVDQTHLRDTTQQTVTIEVDGMDRSCMLVAIGNPHAVFIVDHVHEVDLSSFGSAVANHAAFPDGINVHVAKVVDREHIDMRSWERGVGCTQACGTGACAVFAVLMRCDRCADHVAVALPGGTLQIAYDAAGRTILMQGPATMVCTGMWHV